MSNRPIIAAIEASANPIQERFDGFVDRRDAHDCWLWNGLKSPRGYGVFSIGRKQFVASRVAYALATSEDPGERLVCHSCDNPPCCNPAHLWLGTPLENSRDCVEKGRAGKLTIEQVAFIKASDLAGKDLARQFGVTKQAVTEIRRGRNWGWLEVEGGRSPKDFDARAQKAAQLYLAGMRAPMIAQRLGVQDRTTVYRMLKRAGLTHRQYPQKASRP